MDEINLVDHFEIYDSPDLKERSILEIHKESLRRLFSNSKSAIVQWKLALDKYPTKLKKMIMENFEDHFCTDNDCFWMFEMKTLPKDWTRKYFCLLVYYVTNKNDYNEGWEEKLQALPRIVQNDVLQSLEKYFYHGEPVMYDEEVMNSSPVVKFMKLWEEEIYVECHNAVGLDLY